MNKKSEEQLNAYVEELKAKLEAAEEEAQEANERVDLIERQMKDDSWGWSVPREWKPSDLPVPRMEMHWERDDEEGFSCRCTYMLVYEHFLSIKKCAYKGDPAFLAVPFGQTKSSGTPRKSFLQQVRRREDDALGPLEIMTPFRDWSHAISDAEQLKLPLYITTEDGDVSVVEPDGEHHKQRLLKKGGEAL